MKSHSLRLAGLALVALAGQAHATDPTVRAVVLNGDPVPGLPGLTFPNGLGYTASINGQGQVAFSCGLTGAPAASGIFFDSNPGLTLIAPGGGLAPGDGVFPSLAGTATYSGDNASTSFTTTLADGRVGLYTINQQGQLQFIARDGDPAPTALPGTYHFINPATVAWNNLGRAAFTSGIDAGFGVTFTALMVTTTTSGTMAARTRANTSEAGFTGFGTEIRVNNDFEMAINGTVAGQATFGGLYVGGTQSTFNPECVFNGTTGTVPPGFPSGVNFASADLLGGFNIDAVSVFAGRLRGGPITSANDWGLWLAQGTQLGRIFAEGQQVPDLPAGVTFADPNASIRYPVISDSGHIAYCGKLASANPDYNSVDAIFLRDPAGVTHTIARVNGPVPGFPVGTRFQTFNNLARLSMNSHGLVAFSAAVGLPSGALGTGLFATNARGSLVKLLSSQGEAFTVRPGVTCSLGLLGGGYPLPGGGSDGLRRGFSANGELVVSATYQRIPNTGTGNGLFVITVPGACLADFNNDSIVDFFDYLDFVQAFSADDASADFNNDGVVDFFDYLDFVQAFSSGC